MTDKERIERYADEYVKRQAERAKAWNEAIQECIQILLDDDRIHFNASDWLEKFEALKHKQP